MFVLLKVGWFENANASRQIQGAMRCMRPESAARWKSIIWHARES